MAKKTKKTKPQESPSTPAPKTGEPSVSKARTPSPRFEDSGNVLDPFFSGEIEGLVVTCYENERPLQGLAGKLDWYFAGSISQALRSGTIVGKPGECAYMPLSRGGRTYHTLVIGAGSTPQAGKRTRVPDESLRILKKNLTTLGLDPVGVSRSDFGDVDDDFFMRHLSGAAIHVLP